MNCRRLTMAFCLMVSIAPSAHGQIVIEAIHTPSAGGKAGLRVGDVLVGWTRLVGDRVGASGTFRRPFDARTFAIEQLPRGQVTLAVQRKDQAVSVSLGRGPWGLETGLVLHGDLGRRYRTGLAKATRKDIDGATAVWRDLATDLEARGRTLDSSWLHTRIGTLLIDPVAKDFYSSVEIEGHHIDAADVEFTKAVALAHAAMHPEIEALAWEAAAAAWDVDGLEPDRASLGRVRTLFGEALRIREGIARESLSVAASKHALAAAWAWPDSPKEPPDAERAAALYAEAIALRARLAPGCYDEGVSRLALSLLLFQNGSGEKAYAQAKAAVDILERTAAGSRAEQIAALVGSLMAGDVGQYADARRLHRLGLSLARDRQDFRLTRLQNGIGFALLAGGHFAQADAALRRHMVMSGVPPAFLQRVGTSAASANGDNTMFVMLDFGEYAATLGNKPSAAAFLRLALASAREEVTHTVGVRPEFRDVACVASARLAAIGEATPAELTSFNSECLTWAESARSRDPYAVYTVLVARAALASGDATRAVALANDAAFDRRRLGFPLWTVEPLVLKGEALCNDGALPDGLALLQRADAVYKQFAPTDRRRVAALTAMGACSNRAGRLTDSVRYLKNAIDLGEQTASDRPSEQATASETSELSGAYEGLTESFARLGQPSAAFEAAERGRARSFRKVVAERTLAPEGPKWFFELRDQLLRKRERYWNSYNEAQRQVDAAAGLPTAERVTRIARLHAVALQLDALDGKIRSMTPRRTREDRQVGDDAASIADVVAGLDPGTLLIQYAVGPSETQIFTIGSRHGQSVNVRSVARSESVLANSIARFTDAVQDPNQSESANAIGGQLYDLLLRPIESELAQSERLLIVPDGPLHALPFAALVRTGTSGPEYLVEWKALHIAPSASGYLLLKRMPHAAPGSPIVAVGDPAGVALRAGMRGEDGALTRGGDDTIESADRSSATWGSLPGSRREVLSIARTMGPGVVTLVGSDASEARLKALSGGVHILHLATHGTINPSLPQNSALTLSMPDHPAGGDDGRLQAWEIEDQMRVNADLVTISACESAGGRLMAGEGVMSLTRAFHYAGARSVVSTLWRIDDAITSELMGEFYTGLKAGLAKDEALRQAQVRFIRHPPDGVPPRSPAYWAAFELSGDRN